MKDLDELKKLAEPLKEWLASNYNPMCRIVIERDEVMVQSSELSIPFDDDKKLDAVTPSLNANDVIDRLDSAMNDMISKLAE